MPRSEEISEKRVVMKSNSNVPTSVLKKYSAYCSPLDYFTIDRSVEELLQKHRFHRRTQKAVDVTFKYSNDDCLTRFNKSSNPKEISTDQRMINGAWRRWCQKFYNLPKFNSNEGLQFPKEILVQKMKHVVSFSETVEERVLPPLPNPFLEDPDYDQLLEEQEPGFVDNLGSVCFNVLLTVSSFLAPYYTGKKKITSFLY